MSPLDKACKAARKCSSCLVPARWARKGETVAQLLADPSFIGSLPPSATELGTHLCRGCCTRLATILSGPNALALRAKLAEPVRS